jgi:hypothetical protein
MSEVTRRISNYGKKIVENLCTATFRDKFYFLILSKYMICTICISVNVAFKVFGEVS